jgi:hypothetical protein
MFLSVNFDIKQERERENCRHIQRDWDLLFDDIFMSSLFWRFVSVAFPPANVPNGHTRPVLCLNISNVNWCPKNSQKKEVGNCLCAAYYFVIYGLSLYSLFLHYIFYALWNLLEKLPIVCRKPLLLINKLFGFPCTGNQCFDCLSRKWTLVNHSVGEWQVLGRQAN